MSIEIDKQVTQKVKVQSVHVFAKIGDRGTYTYKDNDGSEVEEVEWYVPDFLNDGDDYLSLEIDLSTGQILNWKAPTGSELLEAMNADKQDD